MRHAIVITLLPELIVASFASGLPSQPPSLPHLPFGTARAQSLRTEWAKAFGIDAEVTNSLGQKFVLIPGGRFDMGPNGSTYRVTLSKPYYLGVTEVTMGQYRKFKTGHHVPGADDEFNTDNRPAALVNWQEARAFCAWLSKQPPEMTAGRTYVLPTEAQWEWAARAGTKTSRHFGDTDKGQAEYCWFNVTYTPNPKHESKGRGRQPVGKLKPNAFGLYDMLGNVWEWCEDRRLDPETGESREPVMRGGSWRSGAFHCTSVAHDPADPSYKADHVGFRMACMPKQK